MARKDIFVSGQSPEGNGSEERYIQEMLKIESEVRRLREEIVQRVDPDLFAKVQKMQKDTEQNRADWGLAIEIVMGYRELEQQGKLPENPALVRQARANLGLRLN